MRISPNGKISRLKNPSKHRGTGVAKPRTVYPPSTNISSPVQEISKRRTAPRREAVNAQNKYVQDDFVVDDDESDVESQSLRLAQRLQGRRGNYIAEAEESSDDGFEPIRDAGRSLQPKRRKLGPPITADEKLGQLNPAHVHVIENFMIEAKREIESVSSIDRLNNSPIADANGLIDHVAQKAPSSTIH